jgi:hypothetical protein
MKLARHARRGRRRSPTRRSARSPSSRRSGLYYSSNSPRTSLAHALLSMIQALAYGVYSRDCRAVRRSDQSFPLK